MKLKDLGDLFNEVYPIIENQEGKEIVDLLNGKKLYEQFVNKHGDLEIIKFHAEQGRLRIVVEYPYDIW